MSENSPSQGEGGDGREKRASQEEPVAVAIDAFNRNYKTAQHQRGKHDRRSLKWTRLGIVAAVVYTLLTAALLAAGAYSAYQARHAVEAANLAANAATKQAEISESAQRAWMAPVRVRLLHPINPEIQTVTVIVDALNVGKAPAFGMVNLTVVDVAEPDKIEDLHTCQKIAPNEGQSIVYPSDHFGAVINTAVAFSNSPSALRDVVIGRKILFIQGCFAYRTIEKPHFSQFCFYLYPELGPQTGTETAIPVAEWTFRSCPAGNDAN